MKTEIRILFLLNHVIELFAPLLMFWILLVIFPGFRDGAGVAASLVLILSILCYPLYVWAVVSVNRRRFPRVTAKALVATILPVGLGAVFLLFKRTVVPPMSGAELLSSGVLIVASFVTTTMYLSIFLESIQKQRVRAFSFPSGLWMVFALQLLAGAILFTAIGLILVLDIASGSFKWWLGAWPYLGTWVAAIAAMVFVKYHRAGRKLYAKKGYRPNAAIIVTDGDGNVLLCERSDRPGTIQTVQGGIDPGENPEQAAIREMKEELGLWPDQFKVRAELLDTKAYEWDPAVQKQLRKTGYVGQQQYFFLAEVAPDAEFDLDYHHREFRKVWWGTPEQLLRLSWSKKRPGIEAALKGFGLL